jgi:hypoxanthine-DNA glycosylase
MIASFPPIVNPDAEILILGTMPGAMSLAKQEYYAHKQNHFWKILFSLLADLPVPESFADKVALLNQNNITLWDVLAYCEREGSLDSNIKNYVENDIPGLLASHPKIKKIVFNGQQSHKFFMKKFGPMDGIDFYVMPSTSPANTVKFEDKRKAWATVLL